MRNVEMGSVPAQVTSWQKGGGPIMGRGGGRTGHRYIMSVSLPGRTVAVGGRLVTP